MATIKTHLWETGKAISERVFPFVTASAAAWVYFHYIRRIPLAPKLKDLLPASLNVAAIGIGFLVSAKAILLSVANSRILRNLRTSGAFGLLIAYFIQATWWSASVAVLSAALLWFDMSVVSPKKETVLVCWIVCCGGAFGASARVVWLFGKLVRKIASEQPATS